jgi:hypothetical protein
MRAIGNQRRDIPLDKAKRDSWLRAWAHRHSHKWDQHLMLLRDGQVIRFVPKGEQLDKEATRNAEL